MRSRFVVSYDQSENSICCLYLLRVYRHTARSVYVLKFFLLFLLSLRFDLFLEKWFVRY